jgi:hypothetical protein
MMVLLWPRGSRIGPSGPVLIIWAPVVQSAVLKLHGLKDALILLGLELTAAAKLAAKLQKTIWRACPPLGSSE